MMILESENTMGTWISTDRTLFVDYLIECLYIIIYDNLSTIKYPAHVTE